MGTAVVEQGVEGEEHVIGRHLRSIMETGARVQVEDDSRPVIGDVDGPCHLRVERERLVGRSIEQRLKDKRLEAARGKSLDDVGIHAVERADDGKAQVPTLARLRIDPWKMVPGAVGKGLVAVHREGVNLFCARRRDGGAGKERDRCGGSCSCDEAVHGRPRSCSLNRDQRHRRRNRFLGGARIGWPGNGRKMPLLKRFGEPGRQRSSAVPVQHQHPSISATNRS